MTNSTSLLDLAVQYHNALPERIRQYLNQRGIPDAVVDARQLGWNGSRITIPVFDREGELQFFKLARDPEDNAGPKMMATRGARAELYGWAEVLKNPRQIVICEGEFDRLVLEAHGFAAVTSTAGAGVFRPEWAREFHDISEVYICYDNDRAGSDGAERVAQLIPHARIVTLPDEVGPSGDVTDYFVRLGHTREDFLGLLADSLPAPPAPPENAAPRESRRAAVDPEFRERADRIKRDIPIQKVVEHYLQLQFFGSTLRGLCPFHKERTGSFTVFPETGTFYCFGCRKHGDVITFMREMHDLGFRRALEELERFTPHVGQKAA